MRTVTTMLLLARSLVAQHDDSMFAADRFEEGRVTVDGRDYPYRLLVPTGSEAGQEYPLVVFLHGAGERGADNSTQLHWLPRTMASKANRAEHPCYLLAVQCPEDQRWVEVPWGEKHSTPMPQHPSQPMRAVLAAIARVRIEKPIDATRIYLTGLSMGGYGTFDLAARHPDLFAAIIAVCGGGDERQAERIAALPAWIWHGDGDRAVPVERSRTMHEALLRAGGDARYTELAGVGHDSWKQAYGDDGALEWLFAQRRQPTPFADCVPWPHSVALRDGSFALPREVQVATAPDAAPLAAVFGEHLRDLTGGPVLVTTDDATMRLALDPEMAAGSSHVAIDSRGVTLRGADTHGLANACAMTLQMLRQSGAEWSLPTGEFADTPAFAFRAVMIDCARRFQSLEELRRVIDLCSFYRVPLVQLHLTDHEGFRFPSKAFPAAVSRDHYTREQLRALDDYAAARGVTLVPELDVPGHSKALVEGHPEVFALANKDNRGVINMGREAARGGIATLLGELCEVFPRSPYVHIGGDEVDLTGVADDPECRACTRKLGLADAQALMRWFIVEMHDRVKALGRRTLVWEGFAPGRTPTMPEDLIVVAWESAYYPPDRLVEDGFTVVNASWRPLYIVGGGKLRPHAAPRRWSMRDIWSWHPRRWEHFAPAYPSFAGIEVAANAPVLGAMMCVWEQLDETAFAHLRARLPAFAERSSHPACERDFRDFAARARAADARLQQLLAPPASPVADEWQRYLESDAHRVRYRWFRTSEPGFTETSPFATGSMPSLRGGPQSGPMGIELTATLQVPEDGDYELNLESCDGPAMLWIGDEKVLEHAERGHWEGAFGTAHLKRGELPLRLEYAQSFLHTLCRVRWRRPGTHVWRTIDGSLRAPPHDSR